MPLQKKEAGVAGVKSKLQEKRKGGKVIKNKFNWSSWR